MKNGSFCGAVGADAAALLFALVVLTACSGSDLLGTGQAPQPVAEPVSTPPPPPPPTPMAPPPVDLAGRWNLSAPAGGSCAMTFGHAPGAPTAVNGTIAPEGGCPGNFFTSRKWAFNDGVLVISDFKNQPLAQLTYAGDRFRGQDTTGAALTLSR